MKKHPTVDVLISFASLRSAFDSTMEVMHYPQVDITTNCKTASDTESPLNIKPCFQIHTIAIIAEGIPEAQTRKLIKTADEKGVTIIGPATVRSHNNDWHPAVQFQFSEYYEGLCVLRYF